MPLKFRCRQRLHPSRRPLSIFLFKNKILASIEAYFLARWCPSSREEQASGETLLSVSQQQAIRNIRDFVLLWPLAFLYRCLIRLRFWCYHYGWFRTTILAVPVIVVGNITVGGTGKTPLVLWLANFLQAQGEYPGIVSRGYRSLGNATPQWVQQDSEASWVGDEALLLARATGGLPVVVGRDRVAAAQYLLKRAPNCTVLIADDGLQHYALGRDIEIAVLPAPEYRGNEHCLPAGPLREPMTRLSQVDLQITLGPPEPGVCSMECRFNALYSLMHSNTTLEASAWPRDTVHAVAGIAHPARFFRALRKVLPDHVVIVEHPFPDHHLFQQQDIDWGEDMWVIMTEKDAVKCSAYADHRHWCLPMRVIPDDRFVRSLSEHLEDVFMKYS